MEDAKLERIVNAAKGRYLAGLPLRDAIDHACAGHSLSVDEHARVDRRTHDVVAQAEDPGGTIVARLLVNVESFNTEAVALFTERAARGDMLPTAAACLAAVAASEKLWRIFERLAAEVAMDVPHYATDTADRTAKQQTIAGCVRAASNEERLMATIDVLQGRLIPSAMLALAAALRSHPINDGLRHVRTVYALGGV